jgi:sirohydrochlorin ferrochelatase
MNPLVSPLVIAAHGTRDDAGAEVVARLADAVGRELPGVPVRSAFVDVRPPRVVTALGELLPDATSGEPAVVVPAFLGAGYHVRVDLPRQLADAGLTHRTLLTPLLGADPLLVAAAEDRLRRAGWRAEDAVVLGAAGSRDERALVDVRAAAAALGVRLGTEVRVGYLASGEPKMSEFITQTIASARADGRRVAAVSWLLAPGLFQSRLEDSGADIVTGPLGVHPAVVRAVVCRYLDACSSNMLSPCTRPCMGGRPLPTHPTVEHVHTLRT